MQCLAYLDPGSGSMLLQLVLVGVAGLGVMIKYAGGRILSFLWPFRRSNKPGGKPSVSESTGSDQQ